MRKIISFDLSDSGIKKAQSELNNIISKIKNEVNAEFISLSLDWIKNRAIEYLNNSGLGSAIIAELQASFVKTVTGNVGTLVVDHEKGAYIEFGVGAKGGQTPHPEASELGWEYDVDSPYKSPLSRRWIFALNENEALDIRYEDVTQISKTNKVYSTQGSQGTLFTYNAVMDYATDIATVAAIYNKALTRVIGG